MIRKVVSIILLIICLEFVDMVYADNKLNDNEFDKYLNQNLRQIEVATKVEAYIKSSYNIKNTYRDVYPNYFAGMYISDDATNLIIQIVQKNIPNIDSNEYNIYKNIINMSDSIKIEYVDNSFNELNSVNNYISDYLFKNKEYNNIISSGIDIKNNSVSIGLKNESKEFENQVIKKLLDSKISLVSIKFSKIGMISESININAGGKIWLNSSHTSYCSMGMRVRYKGNNGYLTAGHCAKNYSSFPSGTVKVVQYANQEYYDYAFIQTNSSYKPTNNLAYGTTGITKLGFVDYCPFIVANMFISKSGVRTGYTSGHVTQVNVTITYSSGVTLKGMVASDLYQGQGDSGGVVMIPRTDVNGGAIGIGILSGGINLNNLMYFSDFYNYPLSLQNRY